MDTSVTLVSFQRARVFSQKIAAITASRPSPVAFLNRFSASVEFLAVVPAVARRTLLFALICPASQGVVFGN